MSEEHIILIKLTNNDELIGYLSEENDDGFRLNNPMRVEVMHPARNDVRPSILIIPWNEVSKMDHVYIDKFHVIYYTIPKDNVIEFYKKQIQTLHSRDLDEAVEPSIDSIRAYIEKMTSNTIVH
jgi:hypothetical protein